MSFFGSYSTGQDIEDGSHHPRFQSRRITAFWRRGVAAQQVQSVSGGRDPENRRNTVIEFLNPVLNHSGISDVYHYANDGRDPVELVSPGGRSQCLRTCVHIKKGAGSTAIDLVKATLANY